MSARVKFGPGKYKMRGGRDAVVVAVVMGFAIGYIDSDPTEARSWNARNGMSFSKHISGLDLIHPNEMRRKNRPIKVELWLTIERGISCDPYIVNAQHFSKDDALRAVGDSCLAIVPISIDCMEGDGLDGSIDGEGQ